MGDRRSGIAERRRWGSSPRYEASTAGRTIPLLDAMLPYLRDLDPQLVGAVTTSLGRLEMIHREGAVLMMPEILVRQ